MILALTAPKSVLICASSGQNQARRGWTFGLNGGETDEAELEASRTVQRLAETHITASQSFEHLNAAQQRQHAVEKVLK